MICLSSEYSQVMTRQKSAHPGSGVRSGKALPLVFASSAIIQGYIRATKYGVRHEHSPRGGILERFCAVMVKTLFQGIRDIILHCLLNRSMPFLCW